MVSAYHAANDVEHGAEPTGTLYWRRAVDAPFHCDFAFLPTAWLPKLRNVTVGGYDEWVASGLSDHCPVIVDFD